MNGGGGNFNKPMYQNQNRPYNNNRYNNNGGGGNQNWQGFDQNRSSKPMEAFSDKNNNLNNVYPSVDGSVAPFDASGGNNSYYNRRNNYSQPSMGGGGGGSGGSYYANNTNSASYYTDWDKPLPQDVQLEK